MTDQILFDRLAYIDRLKRGGVADDQARVHAEAMDAALRESVATKADLEAVQRDIEALKIASKADLAVATADLSHKMDLGFASVRTDMAAIRTEIREMTLRFGGSVAVGIAVLAAMKFFEQTPHP